MNWLRTGQINYAPPFPASILCLPDVIHVMNSPRPSPFFAALLLPCIIVDANWWANNRVGLGTWLVIYYILALSMTTWGPMTSSNVNSNWDKPPTCMNSKWGIILKGEFAQQQVNCTTRIVVAIGYQYTIICHYVIIYNKQASYAAECLWVMNSTTVR